MQKLLGEGLAGVLFDESGHGCGVEAELFAQGFQGDGIPMGFHIGEDLVCKGGGGILVLLVVGSGDVKGQGQGQGLEDLLGIGFGVYVFQDHEVQQLPDGGIWGQGEVKAAVGIAVEFGFQEEVEQGGVGGQLGQVVAIEGGGFDEDADDEAVFGAIFAQGVAGVGLAQVAVAFFHKDLVLGLGGQGDVAAGVGKVEEEEVLAVEAFVDVVSFEGADHAVFVGFAQPLGDVFYPGAAGVGAKVPMEMGELGGQLVQGLGKVLFWFHGVPSDVKIYHIKC